MLTFLYKEADMSHTVTMLATTTGTQMNSFLIRTESGKTILMDGGFREDAPKLLEALRRQTGSDVPHIDAWFLSHVHGDHIRCLFEMMEHHREEFTLGKLYFNFPSLQFMERNEPGDAPDAETFYSLLPLFAKETRIVSQGDRYEIGEADRVDFSEAVSAYSEALGAYVSAYYASQRAEAAFFPLIGKYPVYDEGVVLTEGK
jgi:glyoxylase-like metal-dependent hydrolase (beta-lactamase superfamily II)